ncbi:MAG TPA: ThuA domain-containing protein [Terriglobales bacterium]|nr:ThuA domain-containing protein [Terriglobales bacterium]
MTKLLLVSTGLIHPPYGGRAAVKETLAQIPGIDLDEVSSLEEALQRPEAPAYAAMVLYYHFPNARLSEPQLAAFRSFVECGGGVLAIHSATASYKPSLPYFEVLGGRFTGHGPVSSLQIRPYGDSEIFAGVASFSVTDELYLHQQQPDLRVHFVAEHEGKPVPVVWTRELGAGRVCYVCPGHRSASMRHDSVREILRRGVRWVSKG